MKIIRISEIAGTSREVHCPKGGFTSFRPVLMSEGMGFSVHKTVIPKGSPQFWHYKNHLEACYCISGKGIITDIRSGSSWDIEPDTIYLLDNNDPHKFQAIEDMVLISIFNPPVTGCEVHGPDGSYATTSKENKQ